MTKEEFFLSFKSNKAQWREMMRGFEQKLHNYAMKLSGQHNTKYE